MDLQQVIKTRRSIRKYTDQPVSANQMDVLLRSAMQAPSAADARPWEFVTVMDRAVLRDLAGKMGGCDMLLTAAAAVLVCGDPSREQFPGFWPQDCACAAHHIQLAAHDIGLGAVWIGLYPLDERMQTVRETCAVPEGIFPFAMISLGTPDEVLPPEDRYDPSRIHQECW